VRRVLFASSAHVYGPGNGLMRREDEVAQPLCPYGIAKYTGEQLCLGFTRLYGLETVRLRFFHVYGPRQPAGSPYAAALRQALRQMLVGRRPVVPIGLGGRLDLTAIDDAVYAALVAVSTPRAAGKVYNVACGRPSSSLELVDALNQILGTTLPPVETFFGPPDEVCHLADTHKAEVELGFCAGTDLETGLRRCVEYFALRCEGPTDTAVLTGACPRKAR
jgi:UDP-glucose 4-epimerase